MALSVLLLDSHDRARAALLDALRRVDGVTVVAAVADVGTALPLISALAPDLVLYEPVTIDGETLPALRRLVAAGRPVVVLTASLVDGEADGLRAAGAAAVLLKTPHVPGLVARLDAALRRGRPLEHALPRFLLRPSGGQPA